MALKKSRNKAFRVLKRIRRILVTSLAIIMIRKDTMQIVVPNPQR